MNLAAIPWRVRVGFITTCYAGVITVSAMLITKRYLAELRDPATFNSGMAAGGDWFLELFLVGLLLIPTFLLALLVRSSEESSLKFARVMLGFGISAPVCVALMGVPAIGRTNSFIGSICLYRTFAFPMSLVGLIGCCVLAKFKRPRRLILYSVLIEVATFVLMLVLMSGRF